MKTFRCLLPGACWDHGKSAHFFHAGINVSQLAKMKKYFPYMSLKVPIIKKKKKQKQKQKQNKQTNKLWICEIWGNFIKIDILSVTA